MKMKNIAKISLLLGILATVVNTTTEKPVHAEKKPIEISENSKKLKAYYTQPSIEYKNVTGYISFIQPSIKFMNIIDGNSVNNLALIGKDKQHYHTGVHRNLHVFTLMRIRDLKVQSTPLAVSRVQTIKLST